MDFGVYALVGAVEEKDLVTPGSWGEGGGSPGSDFE